MSNIFIVDDRSGFIQYSAGWNPVGASPEYNLTATSPIGKNASATFNFTGTSVSVFASIDLDIHGGEMVFQVDNNTAVSTNPLTAPAHHAALYQSPELTDGPHTLVIKVLSDPPPRVFIDYILYNSSLAGPGSILIDDNVGQINYEGKWDIFTSDSEMGGSGHTAGSANASFSLDFEGTGVVCYGDLTTATNGLKLQVVIDNTLPHMVAVPNVTQNLGSSKIFTSELLQAGKHNVVVTVPNDSHFSLDFITVTPVPGSGGNSTSSSPSPTQVPTKSHSKTSAGAIAGSVIGALATVLLLCAIWFWFKRKHRKSSLNNNDSVTMAHPFNPIAQTTTGTQNVRSSPEPATALPITPLSKQPMSELSSTPASATVSGRESSPSATIPPTSVASSIIPHSPPPVDSGLRFPRDSSGATVSPPGYTAD